MRNLWVNKTGSRYIYDIIGENLMLCVKKFPLLILISLISLPVLPVFANHNRFEPIHSGYQVDETLCQYTTESDYYALKQLNRENRTLLRKLASRLTGGCVIVYIGNYDNTYLTIDANEENPTWRWATQDEVDTFRRLNRRQNFRYDQLRLVIIN
jgi:hypothetical protein